MNRTEFPKALLRISLGLVFIYFGSQQVSSPDNWTGFVPDFLNQFFFTANNLVVFNGVIELTLGTFLIVGLYTKFASLILSLHLFGIAFSIGFTPLGVRDFGLAFATLVIFLNGTDIYSIDQKFNNSKPHKQ